MNQLLALMPALPTLSYHCWRGLLYFIGLRQALKLICHLSEIIVSKKQYSFLKSLFCLTRFPFPESRMSQKNCATQFLQISKQGHDHSADYSPAEVLHLQDVRPPFHPLERGVHLPRAISGMSPLFCFCRYVFLQWFSDFTSLACRLCFTLTLIDFNRSNNLC